MMYTKQGYTKVVVYTDQRGLESSVWLKTIEYDGCEYVITEYDRGYSIAHKGNCKYCEERRRLREENKWIFFL